MTSQSIPVAGSGRDERVPLRLRLAQRGIDGVTLLLLPAALFIVLLFVYPFLYGMMLSVQPKGGAETVGRFANYVRFFSDSFLYDTILTTLWLALPVTIINVVLSIPVAMRVRLMRRQRLLTTILVLPVTLGAVLVAEGLLNYLGPQGWLNRTLLTFGLISSPVRLVHNYWGVFIALIIHSFPFTFLLTLSYVTGIDPSLEQAASTLGAGPRARFRHIILPLLLPGLAITFCLSFVQDFAVFPVRRAARRARRAHARHLDSRLSGGVRGVRLLDGLRDRHDHGLRAARHRGGRAHLARAFLPRPCRRREGMMQP